MREFAIFRHAGRLGMAIAMTAGLSVTMAHGRRAAAHQIQVIGSHNSYHIAPAPPILELIASTGRGRAEGLDYTHRPFAEQFSRLGIRQIELDVFADPKGGLYAEPNLRKILKNRGKDLGPDPNSDGQLQNPA